MNVDGATLNVTSTFKFDPEKVTDTTVCEFEGGPTLQAIATSPVEYTDSTLTTLEERKVAADQDAYHCSSTIHAGKMSWVVSADGKTMTIVPEGYDSLALSRVE